MIIEDREINTEKQDTKSRAFEKGSMTDRPLAGLTEDTEKTQITKARDEMGNMYYWF